MTPSVAPDVMAEAPTADVGEAMYELIRALYPICRSITGDGVRETLRQVAAHIPLKVHEVPTGTRVFDWTVPKEWNIRDAYVRNTEGVKVIDFRQSNLHVLNYSVPIRKQVTLAQLREHLYSLPHQPDWIPYKTSYYQERWGFCLSQNQLDALHEGTYEAVIDTTLEDGQLTYGECYLPGATPDEVLISCHVCHPSLCNDNLSGIALNTFLAKHLHGRPLRYSYRFIFIPGTIGAITWLALNEHTTHRVKHGLVVANVGDSGKAGVATRKSTVRRFTRLLILAALLKSRNFRPTATTNDSSARRALTCRWGRSRERRGAVIRSTTRLLTILIWFDRSIWPTRSSSFFRCSRYLRIIIIT
jgi:aminopeptidase-like protein